MKKAIYFLALLVLCSCGGGGGGGETCGIDKPLLCEGGGCCAAGLPFACDGFCYSRPVYPCVEQSTCEFDVDPRAITEFSGEAVPVESMTGEPMSFD